MYFWEATETHLVQDVTGFRRDFNSPKSPWPQRPQLVCQQEVACRMANGNLIAFLGRDKLNPQTTGGPNVFQETNPHWLLSFPPSHHLSWFLCRQTRLRWVNAQIFWALGGSSHLVRETTLLRGSYQPWLLITYKSSDDPPSTPYTP